MEEDIQFLMLLGLIEMGSSKEIEDTAILMHLESF
jgi:hypothetical protein